MFKDSSDGKGIGKGIMSLMEYTLIIYILNGKGMALWNIVFSSGNHHGKRYKKMHYKRYNVNQN